MALRNFTHALKALTRPLLYKASEPAFRPAHRTRVPGPVVPTASSARTGIGDSCEPVNLKWSGRAWPTFDPVPAIELRSRLPGIGRRSILGNRGLGEKKY